MFLKPHREPLHSDSIKSAEAWLVNDIESAPLNISESLREHVKGIKSDHIEYFITPVRKSIVGGTTPPDVSFKFSSANDFIFRDLAFGDAIVESILTINNIHNSKETVKYFFDKLLHVDHFLNGKLNRNFDQIYERSNSPYCKSFVLNLNDNAKTIYDIDYLDIFFDDRKDIVPTCKVNNLCPELISRNGIALRLNFNSDNNLFDLKNERVMCQNASSISEAVLRPSFCVDSSEYYFEAPYNNIDLAIVQYIKFYKEKLTNVLGQEPAVIDQNTLKLVEMVMI
jgi:hypothetical protein